MIFINLYEIINSLDCTLEKNIKSYNSSLADKFVDELKKHLARADSIEKLKQLPEDTLFTLDRYEGNYAVCENRSTGEMFDIPKSLVTLYAKEGDILHLEDDIFQVSIKDTIQQKKDLEKLVDRITDLKK